MWLMVEALEGVLFIGPKGEAHQGYWPYAHMEHTVI